MSPAKVTLSAKEQEMVMDTGWILTKNRIIEKVYVLFGEISAAYGTLLNEHALIREQEIFALSPKLSRGENYEGLPWVMLDQLRYYKQQDAFGIRTFFWWGHGFSITLQLSGKYLLMYEEAIRAYFRKGSHHTTGWLAGIGKDPWQHHFRDNNYVPVNPEGLPQHAFIKLTKRFPLQEWENMEDLCKKGFEEILAMLGN